MFILGLYARTLYYILRALNVCHLYIHLSFSAIYLYYVYLLFWYP